MLCNVNPRNKNKENKNKTKTNKNTGHKEQSDEVQGPCQKDSI